MGSRTLGPPLTPTASNMKTTHQWLMELPEPIKTKALLNVERQKRGRWLNYERDSFFGAIDEAFLWDRTPEGHLYWLEIAEGQFSDKDSSEPESPTQTPTNTNMDLSKYSDIPVATVTAVFGTDVTTMKPDGIMATVKANNARKKDLLDTGIESPFVTKQIAGIDAANEALIKQLDTFA
jgi:hypothetical protein